MKSIKPFIAVLFTSIVLWIVIWLLLGQDLNAFARMVLPIPIAFSFIASSLLAGISAGIYRLITKRWPSNFSRLLWLFWFIATAGLILLVVLTSG